MGRCRRATSTQRPSDVGPTSHGRYWPNVGPTHIPCSFFSLHNLPELLCLCTEIVPMLEAAINSGPVLALLRMYTNMKTLFILTHWGPDKISNAFPWMQICEFRLNFHWSFCLQGSNWQYIPALVQILLAWRRTVTSHYPFVHCVWISMHIFETEQSHLYTCEYYIDVDHIGVSNDRLLNSTVVQPIV